MTDMTGMANAERVSLFAESRALTDDQWSTMTVCDPWTVRHLVAHMTALGNQTAPNFFSGLIKNGFSFDKFVAKDLQKFNVGSNADVLAGFARTVEQPKTPPGPVALLRAAALRAPTPRLLGSVSGPRGFAGA